MSYSIFSLVRNAIGYHQNWQKAWRSPDPKREYDVVLRWDKKMIGRAIALAQQVWVNSRAALRPSPVIPRARPSPVDNGQNNTIFDKTDFNRFAFRFHNGIKHACRFT